MKKALTLLLALGLILSLAACGILPDEESVKTVNPGKLTVAFSPDFAPMEFVDVTKEGQDKYVGFDITLAKFIAEYLHLQLQLVPMSFDACQQAVAEGTVDMSISGYNWSQQREEDFNLSDYYYATVSGDAQVLITLAANGDAFAAEDSLAGIKIGAQDILVIAGHVHKQTFVCLVDHGVVPIIQGQHTVHRLGSVVDLAAFRFYGRNRSQRQ